MKFSEIGFILQIAAYNLRPFAFIIPHSAFTESRPNSSLNGRAWRRNSAVGMASVSQRGEIIRA
jgi:hypothetical protein